MRATNYRAVRLVCILLVVAGALLAATSTFFFGLIVLEMYKGSGVVEMKDTVIQAMKMLSGGGFSFILADYLTMQLESTLLLRTLVEQGAESNRKTKASVTNDGYISSDDP